MKKLLSLCILALICSQTYTADHVGRLRKRLKTLMQPYRDAHQAQQQAERQWLANHPEEARRLREEAERKARERERRRADARMQAEINLQVSQQMAIQRHMQLYHKR